MMEGKLGALYLLVNIKCRFKFVSEREVFSLTLVSCSPESRIGNQFGIHDANFAFVLNKNWD